MYENAARRFELQVDYVSFAAKLNLDMEGKLVGGEYSGYDYGGEAAMFRVFGASAGTSADEETYVGDSDNDVQLFHGANGVAFVSESDGIKRRGRST